MRIRHLSTLLVTAVLVTPSPAFAGDEGGIIIDATHILPREGVHAGATGIGAEVRFLDTGECITGSIGGFATVGAEGGPVRQDVLDVHFQVGMKPERMERFAPYLGVGLDVLHVTTHEMERSMRGTTLGISGQAGVIGKVGDSMMFRATAGYLGAIVPGTGDDLGAWVLQLGIGLVLDD
jgi:hypothetical protein